jgi:membrane protein implicated in regulation of membrane protease activity
MNGVINWSLIAVGAILILLEVVLGAVSGFDLLLIGSALLLGGVLGQVIHSGYLGLTAAAVLSLLYVFLGRRRIRGKLMRPNIPSNTDALLGRTAMVTEAVGADRAGRIKCEGEEWRALHDDTAAAGSGTRAAASPGGPLQKGSKVRVTRIDGVTAYVVPAEADALRKGDHS